MISNDIKALRSGKITASQFYRIMTRGRNKNEPLGDTAITYIYEIIAEIMTNGISRKFEEFSSKAVEWGNRYEPEAIRVYSEYNSVEVREGEFIEYSLYAGCTPDGFVGDDGLIEVKCPYLTKNHIKHLLCNTQEELKDISKEYYWQCQFQLFCTGREWVDFVSYDPRCDERFCLHILRVDRREDIMNEIKAQLEIATMYIEDTIRLMINKSR